MSFLYNLFIGLYSIVIRIASMLGNRKAELWVQGRKNWQEALKKSTVQSAEKKIWFHCASLGEFEQGRPLIEEVRKRNPGIFIILTFFSPSGYEVRKGYSAADLICYLPIDSPKNARRFLELTSPSLAIFIKYEYWLNYFLELQKREIPLMIVSAIFNRSQVFFRFYGGFFRKMLGSVSHFFVQDESSKNLLKEIGFSNATVTGDTRFDRVTAIVSSDSKLPAIEKFKGAEKLIVAGSTWQEDEQLLIAALIELKFTGRLIIAPHEVSESRIQLIVKSLDGFCERKEVALFSSGNIQAHSRVLIIDSIGILSSVYRYGTLAWIGGGFGKGIHNILEAAAFGLPVIFGPNYKKFREARELIAIGGAFTVRQQKEAGVVLHRLLTDEQILRESSKACSSFVNSHTGATSKIIASLPV